MLDQFGFELVEIISLSRVFGSPIHVFFLFFFQICVSGCLHKPSFAFQLPLLRGFSKTKKRKKKKKKKVKEERSVF